MLQVLVLFTVLCCSIVAADSSRKFNVTRTDIVNSWQSSELNNRCFLDTAIAGNWDYFHSANITDSTGYQWLLVQLTHPIRVQAVSVYYGATDASQAENMEILLSHTLPPGLNHSNGSCHATLPSTLNSVIPCGVTGRTDSFSKKLRVECSYDAVIRNRKCPNMTAYILIRKYYNGSNEINRQMRFVALEVEEATRKKAQIFTCSHDAFRPVCKVNSLRGFPLGDNVFTLLCTPCRLVLPFVQARCQIANRSGGIKDQMIVPPFSQEFVVPEIFHQFTPDIQGGSLRCLFLCGNRTVETATEPIGYGVPPPSLVQSSGAVQIGSEWFLREGAEYAINFTSHDAYQRPAHACRLMSPADVFGYFQGHHSTGLMLSPIKQLFSQQEISGFNAGQMNNLTSLITEYRVNVSADMSGKMVQCYSNSPWLVERRTLLPIIVRRSKPQILLHLKSSWKDGDTVKVLLYDTENDPQIPAIHSCFLETPDGNTSLTGVSTARESTTYSLKVDRNWSDTASLACLVNQSGLMETWTRHWLPKALYPMNVKWPTSPTQSVNEGDILSVEVTADGNPEPSSQCWLQLTDGSLIVLSRTQHRQFVSSFSTIALVSMNGSNLTCLVAQAGLSSTAANQTFTQLITVAGLSRSERSQLQSMALLSIAAIAAVTVTVSLAIYIWAQTGSTRGRDASPPSDQIQANGVHMVPINASRDPNTVYDEEETLPTGVQAAARDPNTIYYSEN